MLKSGFASYKFVVKICYRKLDFININQNQIKLTISLLSFVVLKRIVYHVRLIVRPLGFV